MLTPVCLGYPFPFHMWERYCSAKIIHVDVNAFGPPFPRVGTILATSRLVLWCYLPIREESKKPDGWFLHALTLFLLTFMLIEHEQGNKRWLCEQWTIHVTLWRNYMTLGLRLDMIVTLRRKFAWPLTSLGKSKYLDLVKFLVEFSDLAPDKRDLVYPFQGPIKPN